MTERGILFTPENYGKCESGVKIQTRRIMKPQPVGDVEWFGCHRSSNLKQDGQWAPMKGDPKDMDCWESADGLQIRCPYGLPGDRLYVKEGLMKDGYYVRYRRGDRQRVILSCGENPKWQWKKDYLSPLHMPKWAARLWLELTDVRVERVQDITEEDALAEGVQALPGGMFVGYNRKGEAIGGTTAQGAFMMLWESIHGPGAWARNEWLWCLTFTKVRPA